MTAKTKDNPLTTLEKATSISRPEHVSFDLFDKEVLLTPPRPHYRLTAEGGRIYYTVDFDESGEPSIQFYYSVNTLVKQLSPTSPYLIEWYKKHGVAADGIARRAADFGTFEHVLLSEYYLEGRLPITYKSGPASQSKIKSTLLDFAHEYIEKNHKGEYDPVDWASEAARDMACLHAFDTDYEFQPVFVEGIVSAVFDTPGGKVPVAGAIDTVGFVNYNRKRRLAMMDWKSGRHASDGYYDRALALRIYKLLFEANFNHLGPVELLYNVSPKNWRKKPTYHLTNQTEQVSDRELELLLELAAHRLPMYSRNVKRVVGEIIKGEPIDDNIQDVQMESLLLENHLRHEQLDTHSKGGD